MPSTRRKSKSSPAVSEAQLKKANAKHGRKKKSKSKGSKKKRMSKAERLTHYSNLVLNLEPRYHESVTHEQKLALAKELIKALRWEMKHNRRTATHM